MAQADLTEDQVLLLRQTRVGRRLCRLTVRPVESWCDRPIMRAPPEAETFLPGPAGEPPPRPVLKRRWRTRNVVELARTIRDDGAYDGMPILADALMDAGCGDDRILAHCKEGGPHVKGCWVLDLILKKK